MRALLFGNALLTIVDGKASSRKCAYVSAFITDLYLPKSYYKIIKNCVVGVVYIDHL